MKLIRNTLNKLEGFYANFHCMRHMRNAGFTNFEILSYYFRCNDTVKPLAFSIMMGEYIDTVDQTDDSSFLKSYNFIMHLKDLNIDEDIVFANLLKCGITATVDNNTLTVRSKAGVFRTQHLTGNDDEIVERLLRIRLGQLAHADSANFDTLFLIFELEVKTTKMTVRFLDSCWDNPDNLRRLNYSNNFSLRKTNKPRVWYLQLGRNSANLDLNEPARNRYGDIIN